MNKLNKFDKKSIESNLSNKIKKNIVLKLYSETASTNNSAKKFIKNHNQKFNNEEERFFVFAADKQLNGRGRRGSSWDSEDSASIYVSFLFRAEGELENIPQLTAAAALAVSKTLNDFDLKNIIKWPNDIMASNKKIAGILSELVLLNQDKSSSNKPFVVIGCGLNLNNNKFEAELVNTATSYYLEKGNEIDKNIFLAILIKNFYFYISKYFSSARKEIIEKWKSELNLKGKKINLEFKNKVYTAIIKDILDSGEILASFADGREKILQSINTSLDYHSLKKYN